MKVSIPFRSGSPSTGVRRSRGSRTVNRVSIPFRSGSPSTDPSGPGSGAPDTRFQSPSDREVHRQPGGRYADRRRWRPVSIPFRSGSPSTGSRLRRAWRPRWKVSIPFRSGSPSTAFHKCIKNHVLCKPFPALNCDYPNSAKNCWR